MDSYDDVTKAKLPTLGAPGGAAAPAPVPTDIYRPTLDRMAALASAQVAPQPRPTVNPLMGPDTGSMVLPVLQSADAYMREKQDTALSNARQILATGLDAVTKPSSNYVGSGPTDPDVNGQKVPAPAVLEPARATAEIYNRMIGTPARAAVSSLPDYDPRTGANPEIAVPPRPDMLNPFAVRPGAAPAPAAGPTPVYETTNRPTRADIVVPQAPAAAGAPPPAAARASRTPVPDGYSGPAASTSVTPSLGVEGFQRQLANIRALDVVPPPGPGIIGADTLAEQERSNAEKTARWRQDDLLMQFKNDNTPAGKAAYAALAKEVISGQTQLGAAGMRETGATARNADTIRNTARGQDLQHGLGMEQVGTTRQGQKLAHEVGMTNAGETRRAHDLTAAVQREGHGVQLAGQESQLAASRARDDAAAANNLATNAAHLTAADMQVKGHERVAKEQQKAAREIAILRSLPPGFQYVNGVIYQPVKGPDGKLTMQPMPMPAGAPQPAQ